MFSHNLLFILSLLSVALLFNIKLLEALFITEEVRSTLHLGTFQLVAKLEQVILFSVCNILFHMLCTSHRNIRLMIRSVFLCNHTWGRLLVV